jgi:Fe-S-cluster containining protein
MITDLIQIRRLGDKKRDENAKFRKHLKRHHFNEPKFRKMSLEIEESIDCRACANCCRVATTRITERDIDRLSRFLRIKPAEFVRDYTMESAEEGMILRRDEQSGCIFLSGNDCTVYEARPHNCVDFPHLVRGEGSLVSRMWEMPDRACYCPIVYNALEAFKTETGFSK